MTSQSLLANLFTIGWQDKHCWVNITIIVSINSQVTNELLLANLITIWWQDNHCWVNLFIFVSIYHYVTSVSLLINLIIIGSVNHHVAIQLLLDQLCHNNPSFNQLANLSIKLSSASPPPPSPPLWHWADQPTSNDQQTNPVLAIPQSLWPAVHHGAHLIIIVTSYHQVTSQSMLCQPNHHWVTSQWLLVLWKRV